MGNYRPLTSLWRLSNPLDFTGAIEQYCPWRDFQWHLVLQLWGAIFYTLYWLNILNKIYQMQIVYDKNMNKCTGGGVCYLITHNINVNKIRKIWRSHNKSNWTWRNLLPETNSFSINDVFPQVSSSTLCINIISRSRHIL